MRNVIICLLLVLGFSTARAQEQERRLVDRLLKPDTTLANGAQNKKFVASGRSIDKQAATRSFYIANKPRTKEYAAQREFSATEFAAHHFRDGEITATMQARAQRAKAFSIDDGTGALMVRNASASDKKIAGSDFSASRPFLDKGKSQKALSQHNKPLTIEQVRELLNKNK